MTSVSHGAPALPRLTRRVKAALLAEILVTYVRVRWLMRRDMPSTLARLRRDQPPRPASPEAEHLLAVRLGKAVVRSLGVVGRLVDSRCLMRSLVLTGMLARRGIPATLVIGVRPGEKFEAHAWVEHEGTALLPPGEPLYSRLAEM